MERLVDGIEFVLDDDSFLLIIRRISHLLTDDAKRVPLSQSKVFVKIHGGMQIMVTYMANRQSKVMKVTKQSITAELPTYCLAIPSQTITSFVPLLAAQYLYNRHLVFSVKDIK